MNSPPTVTRFLPAPKGRMLLVALGCAVLFGIALHLASSSVSLHTTSPLASFSGTESRLSFPDVVRANAVAVLADASDAAPLSDAAKKEAPADVAAAMAMLPPAPSGDYELTLTADQLEALIETKYAAFFRTLTLPPERLARLRSVLAERQQVTIDAANAAVLFGLNPVHDLPAVREAIVTFQTSIDAVLRSEFGETVFAAWREFDETIPERNVANDLARRAAAREPLRPDQEKRLVQILKQFRRSSEPADFARTIYGPIDARAFISDDAISAAANVLSTEQLEALRELRRQVSSAEESSH